MTAKFDAPRLEALIRTMLTVHGSEAGLAALKHMSDAADHLYGHDPQAHTISMAKALRQVKDTALHAICDDFMRAEPLETKAILDRFIDQLDD